jgi:hypothetical protein
MGNFSHLPLQKAVYQQLTGDTALMALVTGIHDRPPQSSIFPYITVGESISRDWSTMATTGLEQVITLHVWSREGGRKEAALIMERIHVLLHEGTLSVEGQTLVLIRFISSSVLLEDDGWTYQGVMRFRTLLYAN